MRWDVAGSPYIISTPTIIEEGASVVIEAGASVIFGEGSIIVLGSLIVDGQTNATTSLSSQFSDNELWRTGSLMSFGGTISITHATIDGVRSIQGFDGASIDITETSLRRMIQGVGVYGANARISSSSFSDIPGHSISVYGGDNGDSSFTMEWSSIAAGGHHGLYVEDGQYADAPNNYWGHNSGPYHLAFHPWGRGANVYGSATVLPFLTDGAPTCCSSILFLPGLKASRLYVSDDGNENRLWEPNRNKDVEKLYLDEFGNSIEDVYVLPQDVIAEVFLNNSGPNIYRSFLSDMESMQESGKIERWEAFAYDWRLDPRSLVSNESPGSLVDTIRSMASSSYTGRVGIVAHSNGGIVAKILTDYLQTKSKESLIDRILFVAVPQIGTPQAIGSLLHGFAEGIPLLASTAASRALGQNMSSAYNLLPSQRYMELDERPLISISTSSSHASVVNLRQIFGNSISTLGEIYGFFAGSDERSAPDARNLNSPSILNSNLIQKAAETHAYFDDWVVPPVINLIQIAGWGRETVTGIKYQDGWSYGRRIFGYKPMFSTDGDGTVMLHSALAMPAFANVSQYTFDLEASGRGLAKNRYHADILEVPEVRNLIKNVLSAPAYSGMDPFDDAPYLPETLVDKREIYLYSDTHALEVEEGVDADARQFGSVWYVSLPEPEAIKRTGLIRIVKDSSVDVDEIPDNDGQEYQHISVDIDGYMFTDIAMASSTVVDIDFGDTYSPPALLVDMEGDGIIDEIIQDDDFVPMVSPVIDEPIINQTRKERGSASGRARQRNTEDPLIIIDSIYTPEEPHVGNVIASASEPVPVSVPDVIDTEEPDQIASPFFRLRSFIHLIIGVVAKFLGIR
ncbi:MAG: hypothetical protein Q8L64_06250 [bacterium]|nr:hypothetical protein [bacterium]